MLTLKKVAITGGLASGKSTVCRLLETAGAYVVSADVIVHRLLSLDTPIGQRVANLLGSEVVKDGRLDRPAIAGLVFAHPEKLRELEEILHPAVFHEVRKHYRNAQREQKYRLFVAEIPLLYESAEAAFFDRVVAVIADPALCARRFQESALYPPGEYERRMSQQLPQQEKAARASYTIVNNGSMKELEAHVAKLLKELNSQ
jgi:dephospho-CoA kinase